MQALLTELCYGLLAFAALMFLVVLLIAYSAWQSEKKLIGIFAVKPYLQLGNNPSWNKIAGLDLLWITTKSGLSFDILLRSEGEDKFHYCSNITWRKIPCENFSGQRLYKAQLSGILPGCKFEYKLLANGKIVFEAAAVARPKTGEAHRFALVGDLGFGKKKIDAAEFVRQLYLHVPSILVVPGDIAYEMGRLSEFQQHLFPMLNGDRLNGERGMPFMRSTVTACAVGNHDVGVPWDYVYSPDFDATDDLMAYYYLFSNPTNGPQLTPDDAPKLTGSADKLQAFYEMAGAAFPSAGNYSFDWGNAHWLVLDSNPHMDWTDARLLSWLEADLKASTAKWRFVCAHHPLFTSDRNHPKADAMRALIPLFERYKVDIVFCGHAHCYERTLPIKHVDDELRLDLRHDGQTFNQPDGIIYIVSGLGGGTLHPDYSPKSEAEWEVFTHRYFSDTFSFTLCDVDDTSMRVQQISETGDVLDSFVIRK